jgi:hypothetical protein
MGESEPLAPIAARRIGADNREVIAGQLAELGL